MGIKNNLPRLIFGTSIKRDFSQKILIKKARKNNIVLSGWGLRDWKLLLKHRKKIVNDIYKGFSPILNFDQKIDNNYLFVHIRRSDFLKIKEFLAASKIFM